MSEAELERVRYKVENGERLTERELELLQHAAHGSHGPALRLTMAHALINAGQERQALTLLEPMRRDFPRDVQVRLGLARASSALERYGDAERALQEALTLNPGDPEALKGLAALALRRGEVARAREWVEEVLRVDPFDPEAQVMHAELHALELSSPPSQVGQEQFAEALLNRLRQQSTPHLVQKDQLLVRLGKGGVARLDLAALFEAYLRERKPLGLSVEIIARELAERSLGVPEGKEALLAHVMPVLRDASFIDRAVGAVRREGPGHLWVFYVLDDSELVRYLPEGTLRTHGVSLEALDAAAWKNLENRPATPRSVRIQDGHLVLSPEPTGLWALAEGDGHDAARLLTHAQRTSLQAVGTLPYRVFLGMRELVVLCGETEPQAVARLSALEPSSDGIPGQFRLDEHGKLVVWKQPASGSA